VTIPLVDVRLRSKISKQEMDEKVAKILTDADYNILLTGPSYVRKPDGSPLCVYLPGAMKDAITDEVYTIFHSLWNAVSKNRGMAAGSVRVKRNGQNRTYAKDVPSAIIGAIDPGGIYRYCRLTAWTGDNLPQWKNLQPFLLQVARYLEEYVPDRYANQLAEAKASKPEWVVPGTPFSTVTVNNTYPTGVHTDKGDLDKGFSTIACIRRGEFTGGRLTFPEYRVAVDLQDGDLILMNAHEWHGNTAIVCACGNVLDKYCKDCGAERISVVSYFRTKVTDCGTADEELTRAVSVREKHRDAVTA